MQTLFAPRRRGLCGFQFTHNGVNRLFALASGALLATVTLSGCGGGSAGPVSSIQSSGPPSPANSQVLVFSGGEVTTADADDTGTSSSKIEIPHINTRFRIPLLKVNRTSNTVEGVLEDIGPVGTDRNPPPVRRFVVTGTLSGDRINAAGANSGYAAIFVAEIRGTRISGAAASGTLPRGMDPEDAEISDIINLRLGRVLLRQSANNTATSINPYSGLYGGLTYTTTLVSQTGNSNNDFNSDFDTIVDNLPEDFEVTPQGRIQIIIPFDMTQDVDPGVRVTAQVFSGTVDRSGNATLQSGSGTVVITRSGQRRTYRTTIRLTKFRFTGRPTSLAGILSNLAATADVVLRTDLLQNNRVIATRTQQGTFTARTLRESDFNDD